ncbi:MAG TPA: hypothetical protein VM864_00400 [Pyrinomonadaceae bacterium]|nr:hypothetical protein [Pyrinomonadaceae bacterium]
MGLEEEELFGGDAAADATDRRAFKRDEMIACERCGRASPPTRMKCLYCGAALPAVGGGEDRRRPALKPLEEWERGFNVVLAPGGEGSHGRAGALAEAASLARLNPDQLGEMIAARTALPLARTGEREEMELLERRLTALGLGVEIVADEDLAVETEPPRRVRKIEFDAEGVTGLSGVGGESRSASWAGVILIVVGRIFKKRIEVEERLKRRAASEIVESRELVEDEGVVDLHFADAPAGWRVLAEGFDYSCLGARKSLLASENFARLVEEFRARAPRAAFDDSYRRVRHLLQFAWSPAEHREAGGVRRAGPGRVSTEAVMSVSNEAQFTRYSRLLRHFALRRRDEQR